MTLISTNSTIERLRAQADKHLKEIEAQKPELWQIQALVDGLRACKPLEKISKSTELPSEKVLDIIASLGTWLTHSNKGAPKAEIQTAEDALGDTLFLGPWNHSLPVEDKKRKGQEETEVPLKVTIPEGFEPKGAGKRDVSKALAAIVVTNPDESVLTRFMARTYRTRSAVLDYPLVSGVWYFANSGRLDNIDKVNLKDPVFHAQVVAAYDLLEVARQDAVEAVKLLTTGDTDNLEELALACVKARWISEREITHIEKLIKAASARPASLGTLKTQLRYFSNSAERAPKMYLPDDISLLNVGQVQRICQAAGLSIGTDQRAEESAIRTRLKELGLSSDIDRLVPEGLRAAQVGQLDEFWDVMNARINGDNSWASALSELFQEQKA